MGKRVSAQTAIRTQTLFIPIILRFILVFVNQILVLFHNPALAEISSVVHYALFFVENADFIDCNDPAKTFFFLLSIISSVKTPNERSV